MSKAEGTSSLRWIRRENKNPNCHDFTLLPDPENSKKRSIDQVEKVARPFDDLKIDDDQVLKNITQRSQCADCKKTVKYFCYRCLKVVGMDRETIPKVHLPVHLDV